LAVVKWRGAYNAQGVPFGLNGATGGAGCLNANGPMYDYYYSGAAGLQGGATDFNIRVPKERHLAGFANSGGNTYIQVNGLRSAAIANSYSTTSAGVRRRPTPHAGRHQSRRCRSRVGSPAISRCDRCFALLHPRQAGG
jgi:hypothetical protein